MSSRFVAGVLAGLLTTGCAATTPPPRFSAVSPADAEAPEADTPPASPTLSGEASLEAKEVSKEGTKPAADHQGHGTPDAQGPTTETYSCSMHPEVRQSAPGSCPKCGMPLVKRESARPRP
jgi:hypothetical protein